MAASNLGAILYRRFFSRTKSAHALWLTPQRFSVARHYERSKIEHCSTVMLREMLRAAFGVTPCLATTRSSA